MFGRGQRETGRSRGLRWFAAGAGVAIAAVTVLATPPAQAEAAKTTATLTVTGVLDSNCTVSAGGTAVYVAPGGEIDFKADLAGISVKVPLVGVVHLDTNTVASFVDTLTIDGDAKHAIAVSGTHGYALKGVSGNHSFAWSASSVQLLPIPLVAPKGITVHLNANTVVPSSLPAGAKLAWQGTIHTSASSTCGVSAQLPGVTATIGPIKVTVPPVALPSVTVPNLPNLPGGPGSKTTSNKPGDGSSYTPQGKSIPAQVVPSGYGNGSGTVNDRGFGNALPNLGNGAGSNNGTTSTAPNGQLTTLDPSNTQQKSKTVELAAMPSPSAQLPVLLAIIAIIALSLVAATYAQLYLLRKPPSA